MINQEKGTICYRKKYFEYIKAVNFLNFHLMLSNEIKKKIKPVKIRKVELNILINFIQI